MLTCITSCSKHIGAGAGDGSLPPQQLNHDDEDQNVAVPTPKHSIKALTSQIKDIALKPCKPCSGSSNRKPNVGDDYDSSSISERFHCSYKRTMSSADSTPRVWGKEMEARLKGLSSGQATPSSVSGRTESVIMDDDDDDDDGDEPKEWVAQVEPGVLVTFALLPNGGNDLKRIRFSRDVFNKWQAQRWWAENYDKVMELYNVQRFNRQAVALPTPPRSEDESSKIESDESSPETPPLSTERKPRNLHHPNGKGSSSDSLDQHPMQSHKYNDSALASTPKLSSISGEKTETSSIDASARTSSYREGDRSGEVSFSNASDGESEWIEQDVPGVYITIRALPSGARELRRVRFSREKFEEMQARSWWDENRQRIQDQYL